MSVRESVAEPSVSADAGPPPATRGIWSLIVSDYEAQYSYKGEDERRRRLLFVPRMLTNSSMHATVLVRLCTNTPRWTAWIWRRLLLSWHSIEWARDTTIGPGLQLPHPHGITIGAGTEMGENVKLFHVTTAGPQREGRGYDPAARLVIGDGVEIFTGAVIVGALHIGARATVGANQLLLEDVPAGGRATRGRVWPAREA